VNYLINNTKDTNMHTTGLFPHLDPDGPGPEIDATEAARRDRIVSAAADAGKILQTGRTPWREAFDKDPSGTERLLTASASEGGLVAAKFVSAASGQPTTTGLFPHLDEAA
jgi:hypothetical protein